MKVIHDGHNYVILSTAVLAYEIIGNYELRVILNMTFDINIKLLESIEQFASLYGDYIPLTIVESLIEDKSNIVSTVSKNWR